MEKISNDHDVIDGTGRPPCPAGDYILCGYVGSEKAGPFISNNLEVRFLSREDYLTHHSWNGPDWPLFPDAKGTLRYFVLGLPRDMLVDALGASGYGLQEHAVFWTAARMVSNALHDTEFAAPVLYNPIMAAILEVFPPPDRGFPLPDSTTSKRDNEGGG